MSEQADQAGADDRVGLEAFPALERLGARGRRRRVPYVAQMQWSDCGAACLAMVLGYHDRPERLEDVREMVGVGRDGADMLSILRAAERYGMRGRGLSLDVDDLRYLPAGTILHWEFNHFIVFERKTRRGVEVVDPGAGRRLIPLEQFRKKFTGIALVLEPTEAFEPGERAGGHVWRYLKRLLSQRGLITRIVVVSLLLRLFALALPILTGLIVDRVVPRGDVHLLTVVGVGLGAMVLFLFLSELVRAHLLLQLRTNLDTRMTLGFIDHLVDLPYAFFQRRSAGDLIMRVNNNATVREILTANTLSGLLDGMMVIAYLGVIFLFSAQLAFLVLGLGVLQVVVFLAARKRYRELMTQNLEAQAKAQNHLVQLLAGIETLKATGSEHRSVEHWSNLFVDDLNVGLRRGRLSALVDSIMGALSAGSPLLVLGVGAVLVIEGQISLGMMLALNALAMGFLQPLSMLVASALQLQLLGGYIERIDDVLGSDPEQTEGSRVAPRLKGHIEVKEASFRYGPHAPWVVRDVSVDIPAGSSVAIVGRSGSGKSTLASLLVALYRPAEGRILYDGNDLRELELRSVRRQLGIVPQDPFIFGNSIRANIALADPSAPIERIVDAARIACSHDDIKDMPMGYETIVADGGASLSGGQRQRLALARALVHRPAILLLDEATSALDSKTEEQITRNLQALRTTRIIIAHRLSTVAKADVILVMDKGRIIERGSHERLLVQKGAYYELVSAQTSGTRRESLHAF
jgi:ATP-binding cassette, subfamily B, bacterial